VIGSFLLRGFLGGLWSHTLFSALAGAGVAYVVHSRNRWRYLVALGALAGAWLFHFLWNSPWLTDGFGYGALGVVAALLIKGIPALLLVLTLVRQAGRQEAAYYLQLLHGDEDVATARELSALGAGRTRAAARRHALQRRGRAGQRCVRRLQRAQAQVALEMSRGGPKVDEYRAEALDARRDLRALGHPEAYAPNGAPSAIWLWLFGSAAAGVLAILLALAIRALGGR
jgi:hypothetical protein